MKYQTAQKTNHDINNEISSFHILPIPTKDGNIEEEIEYKTILEDHQIIKLGYCCEECGFIYPLFLKINDEYIMIKLNEKGIYEINPKRFEDIEEEINTNVIVTGVQVPVNVGFTLDYVEII